MPKPLSQAKSSPRPLRNLLASAALLAVSLGGARAALAEDGVQPDWRVATDVDPIGSGDRLHGPSAAPLSVIVWLDPECPYCKVLGRTPETVVDASGGQANLAVRLYPLPFHGANAIMASLSALCVGDQGGSAAYYRFLDSWLDRTATNGAGIGAGATPNADPVADLAVASGAPDRSQLAACTTAAATATRLGNEMRGAERAHLAGTPAIAVRNNASGKTIMVSGAIEADDLKAALDYMAKQSAR